MISFTFIIHTCKNNKIIIVADFNFPNIGWDCYGVRACTRPNLRLGKFSQDYVYIYIVLTGEWATLDFPLGNEAD